MPLVKNLNVDRDLCADTLRRKDFILQADYIRRREMGKEVSIRTQTMKGSGLMAIMREIAEPEVKLDQDAQQAYADAEDWLCRSLNKVFQAVVHLGFQCTQLPFDRQFYCEKDDDFVVICNSLAWFPAVATVIGDERVYIFRVASLTNKKKGWNPLGQIDSKFAGAIGFTRDYLPMFSSELAAYMTKLEQKAMLMPEVVASYERLGAILKPKSYKDEQLRKRAQEYEGTDFGGWA